MAEEQTTQSAETDSLPTGDENIGSSIMDGINEIENPVIKPETIQEESSKGDEEVAPPEKPKTEEKQSAERAKSNKEPVDESDESTIELPINPHFEDKAVANKPEGDDTEKGITAWKDFKAELKKAREERDIITERLKSAEEQASKVNEQEVIILKEQLEEIKLRNTEVERELKAARFERTPEYTSRVTRPINDMRSDIDSIAESAEIDGAKLWQAVTEPDIRKRKEALNVLLGSMNETDKIEVVQIAKRYKDVSEFREEFAKDAEKILESERAKSVQREHKFIEEQRQAQKLFARRAWSELEEKHPFLKEVEGNQQWNAAVKRAKETISQADLDTMDTEKRTSILAKAATVPFLESAIKHYRSQLSTIIGTKDAKIAEMKKQLEAFSSADPNASKGSDDKYLGKDDKDDDLSTNLGKSILRGI